MDVEVEMELDHTKYEKEAGEEFDQVDYVLPDNVDPMEMVVPNSGMTDRDLRYCPVQV